MKTNWLLLTSCLLSAPAAGQAWLQAPREVVPTPNDSIRSFADFDGDGDLDFAVSRPRATTSGLEQFRLYFAEGDRYRAGPIIAPVANGYQAENLLLAGDVTGDGRPDVVCDLRELTGQPGSGFLMYRNLGGGQLAPPLHTATNGTNWGGAFTDWNRDGVLELIETHAMAGGFLIGAQRWTFDGTRFVGSNEVTIAEYPAYFSSGELTGDSLPDAVVGDWSGNGIYVIPTLPGGGLGALQRLAVGPAPSLPPRAPQCGDIDGDGDDDIVVGWTDSSIESYLAVVRHDGGGGLTVEPEQTFAAAPGGFATGLPHLVDWDGDGDLDALTSWEYILWFENDGTGAFTCTGSLRAARSSAGSIGPDGNNGVGSADFNGDGFADFATGRVLKFGDGQIEDTRSASVGTTANQAVDIDGDGDLDVVDAGGEILRNDGTGRFTALGEAWPPAPPAHFYTQAQAFGDFTGDGYLDFLTTESRVIGVRQTEFLGMKLIAGSPEGLYRDAGFATTQGVAIGSFWNFSFAQQDLDGDGDLDVAESRGWWPNDGTGHFAALLPAWSGDPVVADDVDRNGFVDVVTYATSGDVSTHSLQRNSGGAFSAEVLATEAATGARLSKRALLVDVDGDGDRDFAVGTNAGGPAVLIRLNQAGAFAPAVRVPSRGLAWETLGFEDFDGDGRLDLMGAPYTTAGYNGDAALIWRRQGTELAFDEPLAYLVEALNATADLDGDGDLDFYDSRVMRSWRFAGADAGRIRQYGASQPGASGIGPILGARGPARVGSTLELRLRRGQGAGAAALALSLGEASIPNAPFSGTTQLISPILGVALLGLSGSPGVAGAGSFDLPLRVPPGFYGLRVFHQAFTVDGTTIAGSNGLEIYYGR